MNIIKLLENGDNDMNNGIRYTYKYRKGKDYHCIAHKLSNNEQGNVILNESDINHLFRDNLGIT